MYHTIIIDFTILFYYIMYIEWIQVIVQESFSLPIILLRDKTNRYRFICKIYYIMRTFPFFFSLEINIFKAYITSNNFFLYVHSLSVLFSSLYQQM